MKFIHQHKKLLQRIVIVLVTVLLIWFFFSVRIITASIYFMLGLHAPVSVKIDCAKQTESLVTEKFKLPLLFDQASKDGLREFWHYSYYTGCLQNHGYDHYGNRIAASTIQEGKYTNSFGKFTMDKSVTQILSDNQVDVAYDDRLILSTLKASDTEFSIGWYKKFDPKTLEGFRSGWTHFPHMEEPLTIASDSGYLTATNSAGLTGCMRFFRNVPVLIFGTNLEEANCVQLLNTVQSSKQ